MMMMMMMMVIAMRMLQRLGHCDDDDDDDYYNHQYHLDESHWLVADEMGGAHHHCHCCCCCCCHEDPQPRLYRFFRCGRCYSVTWHPKITLNINYLNKRIRTYQSVVTMVIEQCRTTQTNQQTRESCITGTTVPGSVIRYGINFRRIGYWLNKMRNISGFIPRHTTGYPVVTFFSRYVRLP